MGRPRVYPDEFRVASHANSVPDSRSAGSDTLIAERAEGEPRVSRPVAEALMVKCKGCYAPFVVPDQMDEAGFATADIRLTSLRCPECGIHRPYNKADYLFGADDDGLPTLSSRPVPSTVTAGPAHVMGC